MLCSPRTFQQLKLFSGRYVICLVRKHVDQGASGPSICPVHQLLKLLLFGCPGLPVDRQLLAARVLIFGWVREKGHRAITGRCAARKQCKPRKGPGTKARD